MKAGLLIIATEVLNGKISDVNTFALAHFLRPFHVEIERVITVKDEVPAIHEGLQTLLRDCDFVVTSGGLGPTRDDLTKEALGSFFGKTLSFSPEALAIAEANYARMNRTFPGKEHGYSFLPEDFLALDNPTGFAPGLFYQEGNKSILSAPGVPREFKAILEAHLPSKILSRSRKNGLIRLLNIRTKKIPEEKIFGEVDPDLWDKLEAYGSVSSLPIYVGVDIGVRLSGVSERELDEKEKAVLEIVDSSPIRSAVWHIGFESLEEVILKRSLELGVRFGFAESATGGLCAHRITSIPGSSGNFLGSVVSYHEKTKIDLLGVSPETIARFNVVSPEVATEMARGARERLGVDIAVSITGLAGPGGGSSDLPVGTVAIGVAGPGEASAYVTRLFGDREQLKYRFSQLALMALHEAMEKSAGN